MRRSRPAELLATAAEPDEIRGAITPELKSAITLAIKGLDNELVCAAAHEDFEDALVIELGRYLALTAGGWTSEARAEWINVAVDNLSGFPLSLLLPALQRAQRHTPWPNKLVANVCDEIEPRAQKLEAERQSLLSLEELAN